MLYTTTIGEEQQKQQQQMQAAHYKIDCPALQHFMDNMLTTTT